jgi:hypothetical protein
VPGRIANNDGGTGLRLSAGPERRSDVPLAGERAAILFLGSGDDFEVFVGSGTAGLDAKISHWFLILSAGKAVTAYISCIN